MSDERQLDVSEAGFPVFCLFRTFRNIGILLGLLVISACLPARLDHLYLHRRKVGELFAMITVSFYITSVRFYGQLYSVIIVRRKKITS